jgi:hypothetical protein
MGQQEINPLISELRQHRSALASLLKQLALPDEAGGLHGSVAGSKRSYSGAGGGECPLAGLLISADRLTERPPAWIGSPTWQHRWVMAGDDRGMYGQYPPAAL